MINLTVLVVEDNEGLNELIQKALQREGYATDGVYCGADAVARAASNPHMIILLDYFLPDMNGMQVINAISKAENDIPFIIITGHGDESIAVEMMRMGARDYIAKNINLLDMIPHVVKRVFKEIEQSNELINTQEALRESAEKYRTLFEAESDTIFLLDEETADILDANNAAAALYGYSKEEFKKMKAMDLSAEPVKTKTSIKLDARTHIPIRHHRKKDGTVFPVEITASACELRGQKVHISTIRDITERQKLESQLLHARKMESIGTLAGGVAHDFNNILTAIIGFTSILQRRMPKDDPLKLYVEQIQAASENAANLTSGLLTFSRKQKINPTAHNINDIIRHLEKFLLRIIGEDIEFSIKLTDKYLGILVDFSQIQQVLMNLAANERDAMPKGGVLTISTESFNIDNKFIHSHGFGKPGEYALISMSDTGTGMDEETSEKIFEPFYTTKELGKGTGLGLSIVYGLIKQHNGYINVESKPGQGTTFRIYLPLTNEPAAGMGDNRIKTSEPIGGTETILLAEDDSMIRQLIASVLTEFGYRVIEAGDGDEAISRFIENQDDVQFVVSDLIMPKKSGIDVYETIKKIRPDIKCLFLSGYSSEFMNQRNILEKGMMVISKPIKPDALLNKIREAMDSD